jgi:2-methylisocitrate lyase-like PEP mutase family enzyme
MITTVADKRTAFRALHQEGCFILPNPWDAGSAKLFQSLGFKALASTSAGYAWTQGRPDNDVTLEGVLDHLTDLCAASDLPVNADFESGFASEPEAVAANVTRAIATGIAGLSIEDRVVGDLGALYDTPLSVARIRAARQAVDVSGADVVLVGRTEGLLIDPKGISQAIDKLIALAEAGADCVYAPGISGAENIAALVRAMGPIPVNVLSNRPATTGLTIAELADLGVRRVSVGGALALVAFGAAKDAAEQLLAGSVEGLAKGMPGGVLNKVFAG